MAQRAQDDPAARLKRVRGERDTFAALAFCWADLVLTLDRDLEITFARGAARSLLGCEAADLKGRSVLDIVTPADESKVTDVFQESRQGARVDRTHVHLRGPSDEAVPIAMSGYALEVQRGQFYMACRRMRSDAPTVAGAQDARRDETTGLLESEAFAELAAHRAKEAQQQGEAVEISLLDIPGYADTAARLSEPSREALSREIGEAVRAQSTGGDTATQVGDGRYGMMHGAGDDLDDLKERIAELTRKADPEGRPAQVATRSVSVDGIEDLSEGDLVRGLTYMLNKYSHANGGGVHLAGLSMNMRDLVDEAVNEVSGFKRTVATGDFRIVVQPILGTRSGAIHHYEALCRFDGAQRGGTSPFQQIQFAEEIGLIHEFDLAMARQVMTWLARQPRDMPGLKVAVNLSGSSAGTDAYVKGLHKLLEENDWARGRLLFEITESARMSDLESANRFIQGVRERGFAVCLDDLGAGAASFRYLSALEVDYVKLDGKAIAHARNAPKGRAFLGALVELCHRLGTKTIAEMIEERDDLEFVSACGVDYVQGFLFGKPSAQLKDFAPPPNADVFRRGKAAKTSRAWDS